MRVLHVIGSLHPTRRSGGLEEATLRLCQGLAGQGVDVDLVATGAERDVPFDRHVDVEGVRARYFPRSLNIGYQPSVRLWRHLATEARRVDLVHVTGMFTFPAAAATRAARRSGVPYVVSPSGMCRPWALAHRAWKKRPYYRLIERPSLEGAAGIHATSDVEGEELEALLPEQRVFVVPNAIAPPVAVKVTRVPDRVVFLGRLHPIKGLDRLVDAMSLVTERLPRAELVIAGRDDAGLWPTLVERMSRARPRPKVSYVGVVTGEAKSRLLASAAVLALTSYSESFGLVVAEALAHGTPVVTSHECPWKTVARAGAGAWVPGDRHHIAEAILDILETADDGTARGRNALALARSYRPEVVGSAMARVYEQILSGRR